MTETTSETLSDDAVGAVRQWVADQAIGSDVTDVEPLTGGTQNIVVRLRVDGRPLVLRRPPAHPRPTSDKTMLREIAVLRTLAGSAVPHPAFVAGCDDLDVLGVVFYLMEEVDGFNPGNETSEAYLHDPALRRKIGSAYAADVAALGQVEWQGSELAEIRRPGSFLERQVPQWRSAMEAYRTQDGYARNALPAVDELLDWLEANRPPDAEPGIMHGDIHLNNTLLRWDRPEVAAFIDWEMCTVGDPLLDLAWALVCWPIEPEPLGAGESLSRLGGLVSRGELLEAYIAAGGRTTQHLDWYLALACLKLGVVIEGTWVRYLAGLATREAGERLHNAAVHLIGLGTQLAKGGNPYRL